MCWRFLLFKKKVRNMSGLFKKQDIEWLYQVLGGGKHLPDILKCRRNVRMNRYGREDNGTG